MRAIAPPAGDVASSGGSYGIPQAKRAATSRPVVRAVRAVYKAQPVRQRQAIVAHATGPVARAVRPVHDARQRAHAIADVGDLLLASDHRPTNALEELAVRLAAEREQRASSREMASAMKAAGRMAPLQRVKARGTLGEVLHQGDRLASGELTEGAVHFAKNAASKVAPIAARVVAGPVSVSGDALVTKVSGLNVSGVRGTLARNAAKDLVDLPANAVPSFYLPARAAARGDVRGAARMLAEPFVETARHPIKSFEEHPVATGLMASGVEGAIGRGAGKALRTAPSKTTRRVASTQRTPKAGPGNMRVAQEQRYSPNVIHKGVQVGGERVRARRAEKLEGSASPPVMSERDLRRRVDETVSAGRMVAQRHGDQAGRQARKAVGRRPTAAVSLVAQGITTAAREDLVAYLGELQQASRSLTGQDLKRSKQAQQQIYDALARHDEPRVAAAAGRYSELAAGQEARVLQREIVKPHVAEQTRLAGVKVRRTVPDDAKAQRRAARAQVQRMGDELERADVEYRAAVHAARQSAQRHRGRVAPREHDRLLRAIDTRDQAVAAHTLAKTLHRDSKTSALRSAAPDGFIEPAYVTHNPAGDVTPAAVPSRPPRLAVRSERRGEAIRTGTLDLDPARLVEQALSTQRRIDAADAYGRFIEDFAHRADPADAQPAVFDSPRAAEKQARALHNETGIPWQAMKTSERGGGIVLVPRTAVERLAEHERVTSTVNHPVARAFARAWQRNVLAFSTRWLVGQIVEPALRGVVARAGVRSFLTFHRVVRELERRDPAAAEQLRASTVGGTLSSLPRRSEIARAEDFANTRLAPLANAMATLARTPGPNLLVHVYQGWTSMTLGVLNGAVQLPWQQAMLGRALREHPLMSDHTLKLSTDAVRAAAEGLTGPDATNLYVALGREVDDMFGRYSKFGPATRGAIAQYSPFAAWAGSAGNFLFRVLPRDHPVLSALTASANQASEQWRQDHGLVFDPFVVMANAWLQGSIPGQEGTFLRLSHYTPMSLAGESEASVPGNIAEIVLPQWMGVVRALSQGTDFLDRPLVQGGNTPAARRVAAAISLLLQGFIPATGQAARIAGVRTPDMADSARIEPNLARRARKTLDPFMYAGTPTTAPQDGPTVRVKPIKVRPVKVRPVRVKPIAVPTP